MTPIPAQFSVLPLIHKRRGRLDAGFRPVNRLIVPGRPLFVGMVASH